MSSFLDIVHNEMNHSTNGKPSIPPHKHEDAAPLQQELVRLKQILTYQETKIGQLNAMLTDRESKLSARERACDEKARMVAAAIHKVQEVRATIDEDVINLKSEALQAEKRHQENLQKLQATEQRNASLADALKEAIEQIQNLQSALKDAHSTIQQLQGFVGSKAGIVREAPAPFFASKKIVSEEKEAKKGISPMVSQPEHLSVDQPTDEATPLGYTQPFGTIYLRGSHNLAPHDGRLRAVEMKLEKLTTDFWQSKQQDKHKEPQTAIQVAPHDQQDNVPSETQYYEEMQNFLDFQA